ncbi:type II secretion system protein [Oxalobacteraceae bacterium OM1]|nr:type II secretion system protein [Oxalobacteraceae bacterium OM1]
MRREQGFSYVIVIFTVAILTVVSVRALENSLTHEKRDREAELLFVGQAFRNAIRDYYEKSPGSLKSYPASLDALLLDERTSTTRRPLRRIYRDPMTGKAEWGLVLTEDGKVKGVHSLSQAAPMKVGGFPADLASFNGAKSYQDWQFVYQPE